VCGFFTRIIATNPSILISDTSSVPYGTPSQAYRTLPYHSCKHESIASVARLSPGNFRRIPAELVSYYAFFK
jgi:hypothetical protein